MTSSTGPLALRTWALTAAMGLAACGDGTGFGSIGWRDRSGPEVAVISLRESDTLPGLYDLVVQARERITPPVHVNLSTDVGAHVRIDSLPEDSLRPSLRSFRIDLSPYSGFRTLQIEATDGERNLTRLSVPVQVRSRMACGDSPASARTQFAEAANGDIWAVDGGLYRFVTDSVDFLPVSLPTLDSGGVLDGIAADRNGLLWLIRKDAYTRRVSLHAFDGRTVVRSVEFPEGVALGFPKIAFGADNHLFGLWQRSSPKSAGVFTLSDTGLVFVPLGQDRPLGFAVDGSGLVWLSYGLRLIAYESDGFSVVESFMPSEGLSDWPLSLDASGRIAHNSGTHRLIRTDTGWLEDPYPPGEEACFEQPLGAGMWCYSGTVASHATFYRGGSPLIRHALETYVPSFLVDSRGRLWTTSGRYSGYCGLSLEKF